MNVLFGRGDESSTILRKDRLTLSVADDVKKSAKAFADRNGTSVSALVETFLSCVGSGRPPAEAFFWFRGSPLSAKGGPVRIDDAQRAYAAFMSDGTLLLDVDLAGEAEIAAVKEAVREEGLTVRQEQRVARADIHKIYEFANLKAEQDKRKSSANSQVDATESFLDILTEAASRHASQVYVTSGRSSASLTFRIVGELDFVRELEQEAASAICAAAFYMGDARGSSYQPLHYQGAVISNTKTDLGVLSSVRLQFCPTSANGRDERKVEMSAQLIYKGDNAPEHHAFPASPNKLLAGAALRKSGLNVIAGIQGSGRTSTLAAVLSSLAEDKRLKVAAITDTELYAPGVTIIPIYNAATVEERQENMRCAILAASRLSPDVLAVDSIVSKRVGETVADLAMSGIQVWAVVQAATPEIALALFPDAISGSVTVWWQSLVAPLTGCSITAADFKGAGSDELLEALALAGISPEVARVRRRCNGQSCAVCREVTAVRVPVVSFGRFTTLQTLHLIVRAEVEATRLVEAQTVDALDVFRTFGRFARA